ncbi:uncharacterized protein LOC135809628 [Sycon ciliatum]|uniref:uncharacterized protein LOC135809628 n=1 Tax=Sycon ciliatum TaxID=27933 RepID=UPI0031F686A2
MCFSPRRSALLLLAVYIVWRGCDVAGAYGDDRVVQLERLGRVESDEAEIATLRDEILPMRKWRQTHPPLRPKLGRLVRGYLASLGAESCRPWRPKTCNNTVLALVNKFIMDHQEQPREVREAGPGRIKRATVEEHRPSSRSDKHHRVRRHLSSSSHDEESYGTGETLSFRFFNAVPDQRKVSASLIPNQTGYMPGRMNFTSEPIEYGEELEDSFPLILDDTFAVSAATELYTSNVSASIFEIPRRAEFFMVSDLAGNTRALHSAMVIFNLNVSYHTSWLFTYNALYSGVGNKLLSGVDVLLFDATKFGIDYSLHRIARNITLHQGQEATLQEGMYEVKVVPTDSVNSVNAFKNARSLVAPMYIDIDIHVQRYTYLVLNGDTTSQRYPPRLTTIPNVEAGVPPAFPPTLTHILNSDPLGRRVNVSFSNSAKSYTLEAGKGVKAAVPVQRYDEIVLTDECFNTPETYRIPVNINVPYVDGSCMVLTDRSRDNRLEGFFACWHDPSLAIHPSKAWIFTYNALTWYNGSIEIIIYNPMVSSGDYSLFSIAHGLSLGQGVPAPVDIGTYTLKVVPTGSVQNSVDFMRVPSLIEPVVIQLQSRTTYFASIQATQTAGKPSGRHISVPSMEQNQVTLSIIEPTTAAIHTSGSCRVSPVGPLLLLACALSLFLSGRFA